MQQLTLFDMRENRTPAEDGEADTVLTESQREVLCVLRRSLSALTANEAAEIARRSATENPKMAETYRKRFKELERKGLICAVGSRSCGVTGHRVTMYEAVR